MSAEEARVKLDAARRFRMIGDVKDCLEFSEAAHYLAMESGDAETAYRARACVGRMYLDRAEYEQAHVQFREALRTAEGLQLKQWLTRAYHDCYIAAHEAGYRPDGKECADPCLEDWHLPGARTWAFVHDLYRSLVRGNATRKARTHAVGVLRQSAISASWCINQPPPGGPWYPEYWAKFERTTVFASMSHACGILFREGELGLPHLVTALNFFEQAADEQASDEGYALNLIDAAQGAHAGGLKQRAREYLTRARVVANRRSEDRIVTEVEGIRARWEDGP